MSQAMDKNLIESIQMVLSLKEDLNLIKTEFLTLKKELGEATYQLVSLYDRWAVEHQHVARREADMARVVESFDKEIKRLSKLDAQIQNNIQATISKAAILVGDVVGKETKDLFESQLEGIVRKLQWTLEKTESMTARFERAEKGALFKIWVIVILASFLAGFMTCTLISALKEPSTRAQRYAR